MADCTDVLVIGGGFAGLMAALFAAREGKSVRVLSRGQGSLAVGGGSIDLLGYVPGRMAAVRYPFEALKTLAGDHPYRLAGVDMMSRALGDFLGLCAAGGYPYMMSGSADNPRNIRLLTSVGTMKPACAVPAGMAVPERGGNAVTLVVGIDGLKDFFPRLASVGLARFLSGEVIPVSLSCPERLAPVGWKGRTEILYRDLSTLDIARMLDDAEGRAWFVDRIRRHPAYASVRGQSGMILVPPVLGTAPSSEVRTALMQQLGCPVYELVAPPPGVTGLRLRALVMKELRRLGVELVMSSLVVRPEYALAADGSRRVEAVLAEGAGRMRRWRAGAFIVATGGVYGDGIRVRPDVVADRIFGDAVAVTPSLTPLAEGWSEAVAYPDFAAGASHAFARLGVRTGSDFRPLDRDGSAAFTNVFYAGRALGGYDPAAEKSGNGVALVSACAAALHACHCTDATPGN